MATGFNSYVSESTGSHTVILYRGNQYLCEVVKIKDEDKLNTYINPEINKEEARLVSKLLYHYYLHGFLPITMDGLEYEC